MWTSSEKKLNFLVCVSCIDGDPPCLGKQKMNDTPLNSSGPCSAPSPPPPPPPPFLKMNTPMASAYLCFVAVNQVRLSSNLISILEPHLKELVKQHGEISDRLSVTKVICELNSLKKMIFFICTCTALAPVIRYTDIHKSKKKYFWNFHG